jgi:hypothetical protein
MHLYVSLCLSRACLGKMIIFSIKCRKRCVLSHQLRSGYPSVVVSEEIPGPPASPSVKARMHEEALQKAPFGSTFPYVCPEPVLVNSSISHGHSSNMADSAPACLHSARPPPAETLFSSFPMSVRLSRAYLGKDLVFSTIKWHKKTPHCSIHVNNL